MEQITYTLNFILKSFISVWPYLLVTIPLAVWVNLSDFSKQFKTVMTKSPWLAILLATAVGAFSPFCSCGVIPVISALLIGGVPLAPVFAFWVTSPSMDPEIFFLNALINLYVPEEWIGNLLNQQGFISVIIASVLGVPIYTSNLTALPLVGGLLQLGLNPEAALAFLISGPLTTIPAMVAVYGITTRKVFGLYIFFALFGSLFFGILYYFLG